MESALAWKAYSSIYSDIEESTNKLLSTYSQHPASLSTLVSIVEQNLGYVGDLVYCITLHSEKGGHVQ